jgi:hypothetical protein
MTDVSVQGTLGLPQVIELHQMASSPKDKPAYPNDLLATVYLPPGIDPDMTVLNLNQPRELVKGKPGMGLWT